jgi:predicted XRE-type DNA-binding protein
MKKPAQDEIAIEYSSGNVFADLGLENADELLAKADLMHAITREIQARGLTQKQASEITGLSQSDISNVARNKIDRFSQERLVEALRYLGLDVEINIQRSKNDYGALRVREYA